MSSLSHQPVTGAQRRPNLVAALSITQMWASLAIIVIWLAVLVTAVYGPDIVDHGAGGDSSTIPSVVAVALFAVLATWPVAKYGFTQKNEPHA